MGTQELCGSFVEWVLWQLLTTPSKNLTILQMTEASRTFEILGKWGITICVNVSVHKLRSESTSVIEIRPALEDNGQ